MRKSAQKQAKGVVKVVFSEPPEPITLTDPDEIEVIMAYRQKSENMKKATRSCLGLYVPEDHSDEYEASAKEQYMEWMREAQELEEEDPEFNLDALMKDEQARKMLLVGVTMRNAYKAIQKPVKPV